MVCSTSLSRSWWRLARLCLIVLLEEMESFWAWTARTGVAGFWASSLRSCL